MIEVNDLVGEVLQSLSLEINVKAVEVEGDNFKITVPNTQYLNENKTFNLGLINYKVVSFIQNQQLIVSGSVAPSIGKYYLENPYYKHGKYKAIQIELSKGNESDIMPLVWLVEPSERKRPSEKDSIIENTGNVRLFFINSDDYSRETNEHYTQVINPLRSLVNAFISKLKRRKDVGLFNAYTSKEYAKFTTGSNQIEGDEKNIFTYNTSAIEVNIDIPIKKDFGCN